MHNLDEVTASQSSATLIDVSLQTAKLDFDFMSALIRTPLLSKFYVAVAGRVLSDEEYLSGLYWTEEQIAVMTLSTDPDGPLTPLPAPHAPTRTLTAPAHDYLAALYRTYVPPL